MRHTALLLVLVVLTACGGAADDPRPAPDPAPAADAADALPATLPHSMKGYALYGWSRGGETHFTLVTGTNRAKTFAELDDPEPEVSDGGWVRIRVTGADAAADLLSRVPPDDYVMVQSIHHASVAPTDLPADVTAPDPVLLDRLRSAR